MVHPGQGRSVSRCIISGMTYFGQGWRQPLWLPDVDKVRYDLFWAGTSPAPANFFIQMGNRFIVGATLAVAQLIFFREVACFVCAPPAGLEPATIGLEDRCSIH